jgi:hypothetical protein
MKVQRLNRAEMLNMINGMTSTTTELPKFLLPEGYQRPKLLEYGSQVPYCVCLTLKNSVTTVLLSTDKQDGDGIARIVLDLIFNFEKLRFFVTMEEYKATLDDEEANLFLPYLE